MANPVACSAVIQVRPLLQREHGAQEALICRNDDCVALEDDKTRRIYGPFDGVSARALIRLPAHSMQSRLIACSQVTNTASELFESHGRTLLDNFLRGFNGTIFAYGQTGSGKTFTMGSSEHVTTPGLIQLTVAELYKRLPKEARVKVTFIQIYCEEVHDLLAATGSERATAGVESDLEMTR